MEEHNLEVPQKVDKREEEHRHYQKIATEIPPDEKKDVNKNQQVSETETKQSTTTTWKRLWIWFDSWDKRLSRPFFVVKLPFALECLLSVPGNFFGVPIFTTVVAPSLVAWMAAVSTEPPPLWWRGWVLLAFLVVLMIWTCMLLPKYPRAKFCFFGARAALVSPPMGVALLKCMGDEFQTYQQIGFFTLAAWCVAILPVALLKPLCQRQRPILFSENKKHLSQIHVWLIKDGLRSFPSGDVAGAVAFAYPLIRCQVIPLELALSFPLLSCIGRLYWMAHHWTDVVAGVVVSWVFLYLLEIVLDNSIYNDNNDNNNSCPCRAEWWHALLAQLALVGTVATMRIILRVKVFGSGVMQATNGDDGSKPQTKNKSC